MTFWLRLLLTPFLLLSAFLFLFGFVPWVLARFSGGERLAAAEDTVTLTDVELRARLAQSRPEDLPPELRAPPRRPDVFSGRGYLKQQRYRDQYLALLTDGIATRAICTRRTAASEPEGVDATYEVAWCDEAGRIRRLGGTDSYDPVHAGFGAGEGDMVVDMDASLEPGAIVTVVYRDASDGRRGDLRARTTVIYEALRIHS